jgi:hypothetical protein
VNVLKSDVSSSSDTNDSIIGGVFSNFVKTNIQIYSNMEKRIFEHQFSYSFPALVIFIMPHFEKERVY